MFEHLQELYKYKDVLYVLSLREIKSKYKETFIGFFWAILQPFILMLVLSIVFDKFFNLNNNEDIPYPIFLYSTLVSWNFFMKTVSFSPGVLFNNRLLVTKIYFPKEILILAMTISNIFDFISAFLVLLLMMLYYKVAISFSILLFIPLFIVQLLFTLAISLFLSVLNINLRDIGSAMPLLLQAWMYATPVIYSSSRIPAHYLTYYMVLNPLSPIIESYRSIVTKGNIFDIKYLIFSSITSLLLFIFSFIFFKRAEKTFADII